MIPFVGFDFLEVGCGDDQVNFEASGKFQFVGKFTDLLDNQEWPESFVVQFLGWLFSC